MAEEVELPDIHENDYRMHRVAVTDANGAGIDVTGDKFWLTIKSDPETQEDIAAEYQNSIVAPADAESAAGRVYIPMVLNGVNIPPGPYFYDVQWQRLVSGIGVNDLNTILFGKITVLQQVTKSTS